ncbi:WecB/TagA/CpsF family glycosyltransferase [Glaciimonas sp. PAMC28666]|uniref:WecB/TagA/CpsF family glycosyltransferase n=1 Tax=Glaciimonas sp. PAMC28666 TaxID=2807626 RepID=UPI001966CDC9|nr:WecB/TagA/CpsF family glycosyltransferase [Glaciimonas sp. PAMC28666]QRX81260.1 WecB/TagA/CpsF family glycosyltransferase [Glaciimonas sp. PAMC28666]
MSLEKMNPIAGYPVLKTTSSVLARELRRAVRANKKMTLFFANTNFVVQCRYLLERMRSDSVMIVNDGVGMDIAAFLFSSEKFNENLNGTDFIPYFFSESNRSMRVFMLGSKPEVLIKAAHHLRNVLGQTVVGACDGYAGLKTPAGELIETINSAQAEVVLVALGNPIQEEWILANRELLDANLVVGVGALFDFWSGDKQRAPLFVQRTKLEWLYRLCLEPRRLVRRYTVDIMRFILLCRKYRGDV